jgi:hypothetical protein
MTLRGLVACGAVLGAVVTMGCSDPAVSPPRGGAYLVVGPANPPVDGKNCPHGSTPITVGYVAPSAQSAGKPLVDDENGAQVSCSAGSHFRGQLAKDAGFFVVDGNFDKATGKGTASITVYDEKAVKTLASPADTLCEVTVTSPQSIGGEKVWASFTCAALTSNAPNQLCAATSGVFYFDHCG